VNALPASVVPIELASTTAAAVISLNWRSTVGDPDRAPDSNALRNTRKLKCLKANIHAAFSHIYCLDAHARFGEEPSLYMSNTGKYALVPLPRNQRWPPCVRNS
jgi:hypothetical protein